VACGSHSKKSPLSVGSHEVWGAMCCSVLQRGAVCCSVMQCRSRIWSARGATLIRRGVCCRHGSTTGVVQCVAGSGSVLQCVCICLSYVHLFILLQCMTLK